MKRYAVRVFYEGKGYFGYQRQLNEKTIEGTIIKALKKTRYVGSPENNTFRSASRTDKYVNAIGNVFSFDSKKEIVLEEINAALPKDKSIICWAYSEVDTDFSPKYSKWKRYWYILSKEFLEAYSTITVEDIETICNHFKGEHDFSLFCKKDHRKTIRRIDDLNVIKQGNHIILEFIANSFLWEQVRRITSYILNFNELSEELQDTKALLQEHKNISALNIEPANPEYLVLVEHFYENTKWETSERTKDQILKKFIDEKAKIKQREIFLVSALDYFKT